MDRLIIVDGKNFVYRHHFTHRGLASKGRPTSALFGALQGLAALSRRIPNTPIIFVWDGGGKTWRHKMSPKKEVTVPIAAKSKEDKPKIPAKDPAPKEVKEVREPEKKPEPKVEVQTVGYKANRTKNEDAALVRQQIPLIENFLTRLGFRQFRVPGLEADDLIGLMATYIINDNIFDEVIIHSTDKDFYQLLNDRIKILGKVDPKVGVKFVDTAEVVRNFNVKPEEWTKLRALTGDSSDNILQAKNGIGPVRAAALLYQGLDPSLADFQDHPDDVIQQYEREWKAIWPQVHRNYQLSKIIRTKISSRLEEEIEGKVNRLLDTIKASRKGRFQKKRSQQTDDNFDWMTAFFADYEMMELLLERKTLWNIP